MTTPNQSWKTIAKRLFGKKAVQNIGDGSHGQFALVTPCRDQIDFSYGQPKKRLRNGRGG
ncbi:MAG: hypothetical protein ABI980_10595 [Nitrospirota bacterium]